VPSFDQTALPAADSLNAVQAQVELLLRLLDRAA
jgi:hypothetical protein